MQNINKILDVSITHFLNNNFSSNEIRNYGWCLDYIMSRMDSDEIRLFFESFISQLTDTALQVTCSVVDNLINFIENLTAEQQIALIKKIITLSECNCCEHCCKKEIHICVMLSKIFNLVHNKSREVIKKYILAYNPLESERYTYTHAKMIILSACNEGDRDIPQRNAAAGSENAKSDTIALIIPDFLSASSFLQPALGLHTIAAMLKKEGYSIIFIDNRVEHYSLTDLAEKVKKAGVIIVTTTPYDHIQNYFLDYRLQLTFKTINSLKEAHETATVLVMGAHGTVRPDLVFKSSYADVIVRGPFDTNIASIVNAIVNKRNLDHYINVSFRDNQKNEIDYYQISAAAHGHHEYMAFLPDYSYINFNNYFGDIYINNKLKRRWRWATILASRGCKHNCMFCFNFWGKHMCYREPEHVIEEMKMLQHLNVQDIFFIDFNFTHDNSWIERLCDLIQKKKITIRWSAQARCDAVSPHLLEKMAAAHCRALWYGVESFDHAIMKNINKYSSHTVASQALHNTLNAGILPHQFIMIGLPGETRETINNTIKNVYSLKLPYTESILIATARFGTRYYELAKKQFPYLGDDFFSLLSTRGIVANDLTPVDLQKTVSIFRNRDFIYQSQIPCLC